MVLQLRGSGSKGWRFGTCRTRPDVEGSGLPRKALVLEGLLLGTPPSDLLDGHEPKARSILSLITLGTRSFRYLPKGFSSEEDRRVEMVKPKSRGPDSS
jgi:hypothetical protein